MRPRLERLRGVYRAGPYEVHAKHWWSPRERQSARLAAKVIEYEAPRIDAKVRRRTVHAILYGHDDAPDR